MSSYSRGGPACVPFLLLTFFPPPHSGGSICNGMRWGGWAWGCVCCCPGGSRSLSPKGWGTGRVLVVPLLPGGLVWGRLLAGRCDEMLRIGAPWAASTQRARVRGKGTKGGEGSKVTKGRERSQPSLGLVLLWGVLSTPFGVGFGIGSVAALGKEGTMRCSLRTGASRADAVARLRAGSGANTTRKR